MALANRHLAVSCYLGKAPAALHPAPSQVDAVFFANDPSIEGEAKAKGWRLLLVDPNRFPIVNDLRLGSIQSKYVKFFQFYDDFPELRRYDYVTYYDHKVGMSDRNLLWLHTRRQPDKKLVIRSSPRKKGIRFEILQAKNQHRYRVGMPQTEEWVNSQYAAGGLNEDSQIANTGIIHCMDMGAFRPLYDEIYQRIIEFGQPECQIFWQVLSQKYAQDIQQIDWFDLDVPWIDPGLHEPQEKLPPI